MPTLHAPSLLDFAARLFEASGVPAADAAVVAKNLVGANLRGHDSHGLLRLPQYVEFLQRGDYRAGVDLAIESDSPAALVVDGRSGFGQVQAHRLLDLLLPRARALGLAAGSGRNFGHIGRLGEYAERAAAEGMILVATVNSDGAGQRVAPPGGLAPRLSTTPLCAAIPTGSDPVVLDFATSVAAEGKVRIHYQANRKPVPEGWLIDHQGKPTTDPAVLYDQPTGSILPMGGPQAYKGFGLALVLDILAGGLSGGRSAHAGAVASKGNNVFFLAIDPERFAGREALIREAEGASRYVRDTPLAEGVSAILLPGDPERLMLEYRSIEGIPIAEGLWDRLVTLAGTLGVAPPGIHHADRVRDPSRVDREAD